MKSNLSLYLFIAITLAVGCTKEEDQGILKGDILGKILLTDQYGYSQKITPQIQVSAINEALNQTTTTDNQGYYKISQIPIGNYHIIINLEGYIASSLPIQHIGGKSPTLTSHYLVQIPTFEIVIDSLKKDSEYRAYCKILNSNAKPQLYFGFICYIGNTPEVSKTNYKFKLNGHCLNSDINGNNFRMTIPYLQGYLNGLANETLYLRAYPLAAGHAYDPDPTPALGKPSNAFIFKASN